MNQTNTSGGQVSILERHHVIPLSLFGPDHGCNMIYIPKWQHKMIHGHMNITMNVYTTMWRTYRRRHNHKLVADKAMICDMFNMQIGYLRGFYKLPMGAQYLHVQKMREIIVHYAKAVNVQIGFPEHLTMVKEWEYLMKQYETVFKMQVK